MRERKRSVAACSSSHYGTKRGRRVRALGLHDQRKGSIARRVGRVPSPGAFETTMFVSLSAAFVVNFVEFLQKSSVSTKFTTKAADKVYSGTTSKLMRFEGFER